MHPILLFDRLVRPRVFRTAFLLLATLGSAGASAAADHSATSPASRSAPIRVACVGDSITAGSGTRLPELDAYPAQLQRMLDPERWQVEGFGVSGATLMNRGDKPYQEQRACEEALAFAPDVVVIALGTNDTKPQNWRYQEDFVADYRQLINRFKALPTSPKIWIARPPVVVGEGNFGINDAALQQLLPRIEEVARVERVRVIDLHAALRGRDSLVPDRVHPNTEGAHHLARAVYQGLTGETFEGQLNPVRHGAWNGYRRLDFESSGRAGFVVVPQQAAPGRPWIWRPEFFNHEPQTDLALLERGWHVAYVNVQNLFGSPTALDAMDAFYADVRDRFGLAARVVLEGFSRGGLFAFNWAARHPERVASIYVDAPVLDLRSWPAGLGQGTGSPVEWERCLQAYGMPAEELFTSRFNPVNSLQPLVEAGIPILSVCGDADRTVPFEENTALVAQRYREMGGTFEVIVKPGVGHHPHSLVDPAPIVAFVLQHALAEDRATTAPPGRPIRVLIVDGFSNHDWRLTTALIRGMLESTGDFVIEVSTAPATAESAGWDDWRPAFAEHDVVIQTCNDINGGPSWPRAVQESLEAFVESGGGVYVWHSGNNAFAGWPAYNRMIGLGWRKKDFGWAIAVSAEGELIRIPPGEGRDTGHGERLDTVVKRRGEHAIHAGLPREWLTPDIEVYYHARGPAEQLDVLSYGYDPRTGMNWPLEWVVTYGQGRVYTSTFGHVWPGDLQPERMRCAGLQTVVIRALHWLAGRNVPTVVPEDFPTATAASIRAEIPLPPATFSP